MMNVEPTHVPEWLGAADVAAGSGGAAVVLAGVGELAMVDVVGDASTVVGDAVTVEVPAIGDTATGPQAVVAAAVTRISASRRAVRWCIVILLRPMKTIDPLVPPRGAPVHVIRLTVHDRTASPACVAGPHGHAT